MDQLLTELGSLLKGRQLHWLVTGGAGFIGSHIVETLLQLGQKVTSIDNFSTGYQRNLDLVAESVGRDAMKQFRFIEGDICDENACKEIFRTEEVSVILHQAALGSVPRSVEAPTASIRANVLGFSQLVECAHDAGVSRFVYASSSSVYGDDPHDVKREGVEGNLKSPYAFTKRADELLADVFADLFSMVFVGLRYFNVFGPRQDPSGPYAAVIPRWIKFLSEGESCPIYGDGTTTRDFSFVNNIVEANIKAALVSEKQLLGKSSSYNIGCGNTMDLKALHAFIQEILLEIQPGFKPHPPTYLERRQEDLPHSLASIEKAQKAFGYSARYSVSEGLFETAKWFFS
jgi:UDP-N-acetylglucosamine/UDP-N-acetylgalactosamine 4-epimerase